MSESEVTTEPVVIPGELTLSNPVPPPIAVPLPIVAWPNEVKNAWLGLLFLAAGLIFLPTGVLCGLTLFSDALGQAGGDLPLWKRFLLVVILSFGLVYVTGFGVGCIGAAFTCFWDAARNDPVLEITADGLRDRRSGLSVPWASVKSAKPLDLAVDLQFHGPVTNWQNPFRVGVLFRRYRPKPNHVIVSIAYLDTSAHVLAYTILTLTQRNGGEVISKSPSGLEMYPRLIPQRRALSVTRRMG